jgi:hypothetical protein
MTKSKKQTPASAGRQKRGSSNAPQVKGQNQPEPSVEGLLGRLRKLIQDARQQALRAVDTIQVRTCWEVGRHIVEFEQGGEVRAEYGARLLDRLSERLTADFGKGFDVSNLRYMRRFYQAFPICDALRHELSWTHYRLLLRVEDAAAVLLSSPS